MLYDFLCRLPPMRLIHGSADTTVPISSSEKMQTALLEHGVNSSLTVINNCGHIDPCLDLMDEGRPHYEEVMQIVCATRQQFS